MVQTMFYCEKCSAKFPAFGALIGHVTSQHGAVGIIDGRKPLEARI